MQNTPLGGPCLAAFTFKGSHSTLAHKHAEVVCAANPGMPTCTIEVVPSSRHTLIVLTALSNELRDAAVMVLPTCCLHSPSVCLQHLDCVNLATEPQPEKAQTAPEDTATIAFVLCTVKINSRSMMLLLLLLPRSTLLLAV
jgi:hypothetical protein